SYDDQEIVIGRTYYYKVKACNSIGCSDYSPTDSGFAAVSQPAAPQNVQASDGTFSDRVRVTWSPVSGAARYEVHRATSQDGTYELRGETTGTSYDDTQVTPGTTYWYKVRAWNVLGYGPFSAPDSGYAATGGGGGGGGGDQVPGQVQGVSASDGTYYDKIRITWNSVSGATSYRVYRSEDSIFDITTERIAETTATSFDDVYQTVSNPLELCQDYWYAVSAVNAAGEGPLSVPDTGYRGTRVVGVPSVSASDGLYGEKIVLTWNEIKGATTYEIWRAESFSGPYTKIGNKDEAEGDDTNTTVIFEDTTVTSVTDYWEKTFYYKVKACGEAACGCGGFSAPESGYVRRTPDAPTGVKVSQTDSVLKIEWDATPRATRYEVFRAISQTGTYTKIGEVEVTDESETSFSYEDTTAEVGGTYWYKVSACNDYGCGPMSEPVKWPPDS
ncbi:hypothetical protein H5T52_11835, partial [Candidatus Bipolaricaulota bacterium]|nr:hypothetical protein [Candidatus Bipolaricaulota bacterium]